MDQSPSSPPSLSFLSTPKEKRRARFSDVVQTIITYRQDGLQTLVQHSMAILVSVTILFLLSQIYYIFLPCLKALLWALLCGSALFPFKMSLEASMQKWLADLNAKDRSLCFGCCMLPFQIFIHCYTWIMEFLDQNKILFVLFHFRHQIGDVLRMILEFALPVLSLQHKGLISILILLFITIHVTVIITEITTRQNLFRLILSFIPSFLLMALFYYSLQHFGVISEIALIFVMILLIIGFGVTVYKLFHGSQQKQAIHEELNSIFNLLSDGIRSKLESGISWVRSHSSTDSTDGQGMNIGKWFISLLFTVSFFAVLEHMNVSNTIFIVFRAHLILRMIINYFKEPLSRFIGFLKSSFNSLRNHLADLLANDFLFRVFKHFFVQGDRLIKSKLQESLDLFTSIVLFMIVALMVIVFSVFLSIKVYGECYHAIHVLQNELKNIEFIQESINLTMNKVSEPDYLENIINDRFNLRDDEKIFLRKMLFEFKNNILPYFNNTIAPKSVNESLINDDEFQNNQTLSIQMSPSNGRLMFQLSSLFSFIEYHNLHQIMDLIRTQATTYLPLLKSLLSFSYAFIFVILDSSTFLLTSVLNFIIFALALFYLLSSSREKYKPVELLDHIVASLVTDQEENEFSHLVEEVINSIFAATIKISAFYGVYTWLVHSLFGLQICCIPSVVAAILAAVPLLNAYWASLPACVYLYYFDPNLPLVKSISMFLVAILPSFIVDSSIYSDIEKGGHPYLTGLAITCGVVYYGVEGALFGPLWLCLLFIILKMCTDLDKSFLNTLTP